MKGKSTYTVTAFLFAVILCAVSCLQEEVLEPQAEKATFTIVGNPVEVHLGITVNGLEFGVGTRAEEPTSYEMETVEDETHVDDLWIFEYSASSGELIYPPTYLTISKQEELEDIRMILSDNDGDPVTVYVVANSGSGVEENGENWVVEETVGTDISYPGFMTVADLEATALPTPHPQRMLWDTDEGKYVIQSYDASIIDNISIPMSGYVGDDVDVLTVGKGTEISVTVDRMYAKLLLAVDLSDFDNYPDQSVTLTALDIGNIPEYCRVGTLWDGDKGDSAKAGDYSECRQWIQRRFTGDGTITDEVGNDIYPFIIYIPENIQGENATVDASGKADNVPSTYALNAEASLTVTLPDGSVIGPYTYTAYPGGNEATNFNVRRNCVYRVKLIINYPVSLDAVPSANCIVCLSGQTTTFFPYCREETGGGYNFTDYLDSSGEDSKKIIDHVGIIWQSKTNTNSSSRKGFLGNNSDNSLVWIDNVGDGDADAEAEYLRKIHVAVPEGERGNALVAAYNSEGDIIWSWHIWARTPETDPTSVGTQLYYTYYWDENGIYGKDSDVARIAGYTIMNCNLGAMQDEPTNGDVSSIATVAPTYGLMYEWGRKDPFPSYNRIGGNSNGVFVNYADYVTYNNNYYCDGEDNEVAFANYAQTEANELFHSLPGKDRPTKFDDAIRQSIQNPTAYLCGSNEAQAYGGNDLGIATSDHSPSTTEIREALATNFPEPHDGNWLNDEDTDHYNRLWGGLDPEKDAISKSYDTGYSNVLGEVHLYDDYGEKSIFDPCPYGWRVSPPDLWLGFTDTGKNPPTNSWSDHVNYDETTSGINGMYMYMTGWREGNTSFFPTQGTRQANGAAYKIGNCGNYHNATADSGGRVNIMHIHCTSSFNVFETGMAYTLKSIAGPVRCVRTATVVQQ